jgi:hypothetical protein
MIYNIIFFCSLNAFSGMMLLKSKNNIDYENKIYKKWIKIYSVQ